MGNVCDELSRHKSGMHRREANDPILNGDKTKLYQKITFVIIPQQMNFQN